MNGPELPHTPPDAGTADGTIPSDAELLRLVSQKENAETRRAAWGTFYGRHARLVYAHCLRAFGGTLGEAGVQDIVAETFLRVFETAASQFIPRDGSDPITAERQVRGWLCSIAEHIALDQLRGQRKELARPVDCTVWDVLEAPSEHRTPELIDEVCRVMDQVLSEVERDVIRTTYLWYAPDHDLQRLPGSELSALVARCGIRRENVRKIRERALRKLKQALEPEMARLAARTQAND